MTATIQNEKVIVSISDKGAELQSVRLKETTQNIYGKVILLIGDAVHQFCSQLSAD